MSKRIGIFENGAASPSQGYRERVLRLINTCRTEGAELLAGGAAPDREGFLVRPTVFASTTGKALTLVREEAFGPVLVAIPYDDLDNVVRNANEPVYGLSASICTSDIDKGSWLAATSRPAPCKSTAITLSPPRSVGSSRLASAASTAGPRSKSIRRPNRSTWPSRLVAGSKNEQIFFD